MSDHPYHIYPLQAKQADGSTKTMHAVQSIDNHTKGVKAGFGDTVHHSEEEAHKHARLQHAGHQERTKNLAKLEEQKQAQESAKKAKYDSVSSFTKGLAPHHTAKAVEHLHKAIRYGGKEHTIKDLVHHMVHNEGRKVEHFEGKPALVHSDGRALTAKSIGKLGVDYAAHLHEQKQSQHTEKPMQPLNTQFTEQEREWLGLDSVQPLQVERVMPIQMGEGGPLADRRKLHDVLSKSGYKPHKKDNWNNSWHPNGSQIQTYSDDSWKHLGDNGKSTEGKGHEALHKHLNG